MTTLVYHNRLNCCRLEQTKIQRKIKATVKIFKKTNPYADISNQDKMWKLKMVKQENKFYFLCDVAQLTIF